jgi:hypothetical protein
MRTSTHLKQRLNTFEFIAIKGLYIICMTALAACSGPSQHKHQQEDDVSIQESKDSAIAKADSATYIYTDKIGKNEEIFSQFISDLANETFAIEDEQSDNVSHSGYKDCKRQVHINMAGQGIRCYYIKRKEPKPNQYYPDFVLHVYAFKNKTDAAYNYGIIKAALSSFGRNCNGKSPHALVLKHNEIFVFSTRAEMFRTYINNFAEIIRNYP